MQRYLMATDARFELGCEITKRALKQRGPFFRLNSYYFISSLWKVRLHRFRINQLLVSVVKGFLVLSNAVVVMVVAIGYTIIIVISGHVVLGNPRVDGVTSASVEEVSAVVVRV